ncbi:MAG: triose-phosphate isomerase [Candidatus Magasanikbacteria bacterium RIFCSPLOWO2_01_FULL_43_20b]|uniref:Triosephosphate isomerase n=1 Tax=Candidatus Magasanikbacteria bacterium RIFCSPLOWO2_12_FULL_43_12 TaxID=1798692 RepID=A0A1F6MVQ2_9BACT|nr:MAG: triose-phosphate isomerase [Candidatus Magasanikbacteria bacterium RIFCSPLOWO2_02_FULL_43_22]OGH72305.1 MAG: triose-phosphate isomerase [Candidatus Magasanikbacteria bacterium RIFCSPHIGHO2_02_FULL_44_13]OGH73653.1 MAG: triose-phosphate isomerase [Candidatus Magasanikbacteria bacterium RIFCSPLOWO2_01_FULL_43_20b]OGH75785.1 MAG: triose-phosphate isomerase [Candidatus Magasanikbacteria bacterium RIFCSPLOWO2_12_FULL_43_12]
MKYVFGNWKMYLDFEESVILAQALVEESFNKEKNEVAIFPSTLAAREVIMCLNGSRIAAGAQDVAWVSKGAYTGAVSAHMFKSAGCKYALVGHSERRYVFNESDDDVRKKIEACLDAGLIPVVCVGETQEDLNENKREYRLKKQLMKAFEGLQINGGKVMVAYEPVWAIGSGKPCGPDEADSVHGWIKLEVKQYLGQDIPVLYGGSVNPENVVSYAARDVIDGVLVGGASTKLESFVKLINYV